MKYASQVELHDDPCEQGILEDQQLSASWQMKIQNRRNRLKINIDHKQLEDSIEEKRETQNN